MTLLEYCKTLSPEDWEKQVTDKWTVREVIAHMVSWEGEVAKNVRKSFENEKENPWFFENDDDFAKFNNESLEFYKNYSVDELLEEWERLEKKVEELVKEIGLDKIRARKDMTWVLDEKEDSHQNHHFKQIKKVVENKS